MIGFYNYTVILTYASLLSAGLGIIISLQGEGHPYVGTFFLLFCGLCDAFDGKVARMKKDRSEEECKFGIQIDSLCDLVSFGVLPACIGASLMRKSEVADIQKLHIGNDGFVIPAICVMILVTYILVAMIRLAYFNVMEEKRQVEEGGVRKVYEGLPVTSAALIFPLIMLLQFLTPKDLTALYFAGLVVVGGLFISRISVKKPDNRGLCRLIAIGAVEFLLMVGYLIYKKLTGGL